MWSIAEKHSASVLSSQMAMYFGFMVGTPVLGSIAQMLSTSAFSLCILVGDAIFVAAALAFLRERKA